MSKYISIDNELIAILEKEAIRNENGKREEGEGAEIKRLLKERK